MTGAPGSDTQQGTIILAVAAVLFAALILPFVLEDDDSSTASGLPAGAAVDTKNPAGAFPTRTGPTTRPTREPAGAADPTRRAPSAADDTDDSDDNSTSPAYPPARTTQVADPREEAFRRVARNGTCLAAYQTGNSGADAWNSQLPRAVDCSSESAYVRVAGVNAGNCPEADPGVTTWGYGDITLCLERKFALGQCFLVDEEGGSQQQPRYSANLFTWVDCDAQRIPAAYDSLLVITGVYRAPDPVPDGACARGAYDRTRYWYWVANAKSTLVCATYPAR
jgi:hypothetical protein